MALIWQNRSMKKSYLKRKSKNPRKRLEEKVDRAYQDFFRSLCGEYEIRCELCGKQQEVVHHFVEKRKSGNLRYDVINFVPICGFCHSLFKFRNSILNAAIGNRRGNEWIKEIEVKSKVITHKTQKWLNEKLELLGRMDKEKIAKYYKKFNYFRL